MTHSETTIENLMKVSLKIQAGDAPTGKETDSTFEFIYGVGPAGITPFEKALFGKRIGDRIQLDITPADFCQVVGHLERPLREQSANMPPGCLQITIAGIERAEDREVVKAMVAGAEGGCGDCGCGCGGH